MTDDAQTELKQVETSLLGLAADVVKASLTELRQGGVKVPLAELLQRVVQARKTTQAAEFARGLLEALAQEAIQTVPAAGRPQLIGRDRELAQFDAILEQRQPTLVVVTGEAHMGKTSLLQEVEARAKGRGWKAAFYNDPGEPGITPDTTEDTFSARVRERLAIPSLAEESLLEMPSDLTDSAKWRREALLKQLAQDASAKSQSSEEPAPSSTSARRPPLHVLVQQSDVSSATAESAGETPSDLTESGQWRREEILKHLSRDATEASQPAEEAARPVTTSPRRPLHVLVQQLGLRSPILLLIDGYRPGPDFAHWFAERLVPDIKQSAAALIVVIAAQPTRAALLHPFADTTLSMGPLYSPAVRHHFKTTLEGVSPPLKPEELDAYVKAASRDPEIFGTLTRLLMLARPMER